MVWAQDTARVGWSSLLGCGQQVFSLVELPPSATSAISSSSRTTSKVSRTSYTCCIRHWTVQELASEVATLLVDTVKR